ncbi:MAG: hypothetical protein ACE5DI_01260 [Candidatus Micrarchaeia archaeon]
MEYKPNKCFSCESKSETTICLACIKKFNRLVREDITRKLICPYGLISPGKRESILKVLKNTERYNAWIAFLQKIEDKIKTMPHNTEFHQKEITLSCSNPAENRGESTRENLDYLCCTGKIQKIRFGLGRGGHIFLKREKDEECPYFDLKTWGCTYKFNSDSEPPIVRKNKSIKVKPVFEWTHERKFEEEE